MKTKDLLGKNKQPVAQAEVKAKVKIKPATKSRKSKKRF